MSLTCKLSRTLTGVLIFSVLAGVTSGFITAASFMPGYSVYYNRRQWHPGTQEVLVVGALAGSPEGKVIHASDWEELRESGMPLSRLWLFDANTAQKPEFALVAHGTWAQERLRLGDEITLELEGRQVVVPVAGVWHPFHPQLGNNWAVLVASQDLPTATGVGREVLAPMEKGHLLPPGFRGWGLVSWLLFNTVGFLLYGAIALVDMPGRCAVICWAVKLWAGGGLAVGTGLITAAIVFRAFLPLPMLALLPMTLVMLAASYLLALFLLSTLCLILTRLP